MHTRLLTGIAMAAAFALIGCGGKTETANTMTTTNVATPAPAASAPATEEDDGTGVPTATAAGQQDFTIVNKTGHMIVNFNVSPTNENEWGPDILGRDVLNDGESAKISFSREAEECLWDLRATYDDDDTTEMKAVNLCEIATVTINP